MFSLRWKCAFLIAFLLAGAAWGQAAYNCLPTCDPTDARFLAIANGAGFVTLSQPVLDLELSVPKGTTAFTVGVFDGDARGVDGSGVAHWDLGSAATFSYTLYADPNRDHAASTVVPMSGQPVQLSTSMPDNAWIDYTVNTDPSAQAPSGNYFYLLRIQLTTTSVAMTNAFKIRTSGGNVGGSSLFPAPQPFSYIAGIAGAADAAIVFPNYTPTTIDKTGEHYDGTFDFYFDQPVSQRDITIWDGDFDFGKYDGSVKDTDDPDTPNAPFRPSWATTDTVSEGVATGLSGATGNPPDDRNPASTGAYLQFPPSIFYDLLFPDGQSFRNSDPSGNQEWEQFKVSTDPFDRSQMDYNTTSVPAGIYELHIQGLDMQNLNALLLPARALCVNEAGAPCTPLRPYLLGDTVFEDDNGNGVQDPGEPGIQGVEVDLYDGNDSFVAKTFTDADGHYSFEVEAFDYIVKIPALNYGTQEQPGILFGFNPTTTETCQVTITNDNNLTCDFGYTKPASIGDRVWSDFNGNGVQDTGEPGINNLVVNLLDSNGNVVATDTTHDDGNYGFSVPAGTYTVRIDDTSLPGGLTPTYDLDGVATPHEATVTVTGGQNRTDVDFGYQGNASLGDRVWNDANGDGVQQAGETGFTGVTVQLYDDIGTLITTTVTGTNGHYSFDHLPEGTYTVKVDASTLPADVTQTYDFDGLGTPNEVDYISALAGTTNTDIDFGYRNPNAATASVGDRVWNDVNGDGAQDANETGLNGVTVQLLDAANNVAGTATTSGDGNYTFSNLTAGTYTVRIVTSSLPAGDAPTYDLDGVGTANIATFDLATGQNRTDVDFGYQGTASVGDRLWLDVNGDSVQDAGETGLNGVTVQLLDAANNVIATTTTSGDGNYSFSHLNGGNYSVRVVSSSLPAGLAETYDLDGLATPHVAAFSLNDGDSRSDVDFGYRGTASAGDRVWNDTNANGTQDTGEAGINGVTVQLLDASNNVVATTTTSGDGNYVFSYLTAGTYSVRVAPPAGVAPTYDLDGTGTPNVATFTLAGGQSRTDVDFGYQNNGSAGDRVWLDANGNGVQDAGEAGINGATVQLLDASNNTVASTTTSGDGDYTFSNLAAGTYTVRVSGLPAGVAETYDLDGAASANQASFTLAAGQNRTDVDFGYQYNGSVGDRVWNDDNGNGVQDAGEPGLNGVTIQLLDAANNVAGTTATSGDGTYSFTGLPAGSYTVRIVASSLPAGFAETYDLDGVASANQASFALGAGQNRSDVDFGYRMPPPAPGTDCATAAPGDPAYNQNPSGHAVYMPGIGTDFIFTPAPGTFTILPDGTAHLQGTVRSVSNPANAFLVDVQLSGYTGIAPSGSPKKELRPNAYAENGGPIDPTNWYYYTAFTGTLTGIGNYAGAVIDIARTGPAFQVGVGANGKNTNFGASGWFDLSIVSQPSSGGTLTPTDHGDFNIDLGDCPPATASAGDRVWNDANGNGVQDTGEAGINGVTVQLLDVYGNVAATTTTSGDGNYTFANLIAGTYTVRIDTASLPAGSAETYDLDGAATANQATFTLTTGQSRTDVDFGYRGNLSIGDRVWKDTDGDGTQDSSETGYSGVTVQLLSGSTVIATTTTNSSGNYSFGNLTAGTYTVKVTPPAGTSETYDLDGLSSANQATVNLTTSRTDVDFGYRPAGTLSIGDRVWKDANANGLQDSGEPGISGVTVQLLSGSTVIATTTTNSSGNYSFGSLTAGTYTVKIVTSTLGGTATETYDLDGLSSANQATVNLTASRTDVDLGYHFPSADCGGTGTLGYWKTHSSAWPVSSITIGGVTYTKSQAIIWLGTPVRGDESVALFHQLVPAELNALKGNNVSCITTVIQAADAWMSQYGPVGSHVSTSSSAGRAGAALESQLDDYNNGRLSCAQHRN